MKPWMQCELEDGTAASGSRQRLYWALFGVTVFAGGFLWLLFVPWEALNPFFLIIGAVGAAFASQAAVREIREWRRYPVLLDDRTYPIRIAGGVSGTLEVSGSGAASLLVGWDEAGQLIWLSDDGAKSIDLSGSPPGQLEVTEAPPSAATRLIRIQPCAAWVIHIHFSVQRRRWGPDSLHLRLCARGHHDTAVSFPLCEQIDRLDRQGFPVIPLPSASRDSDAPC